MANALASKLQALPPLVQHLPFYLALFGFILQLHGKVGDVQSDVHALQAGHVGVHADLNLRVNRIEATRFTKDDGYLLRQHFIEAQSAVALLTHRLDVLKIPPPHVAQALQRIDRRLNAIEETLQRTFGPQLPRP